MVPSTDLMFFPLNLGRSHWTLLALDSRLRSRRVVLMDWNRGTLLGAFDNTLAAYGLLNDVFFFLFSLVLHSLLFLIVTIYYL